MKPECLTRETTCLTLTAMIALSSSALAQSPEDFVTNPLLDEKTQEVTENASEGETTWYQDADGDGYGNSSVSLVATEQPAGYVDNDDDCEDQDPNINPGMEEFFNDRSDTDCQDTVNVGCIHDGTRKYLLPWEAGQSHYCTAGKNDPFLPTHRNGRVAWDFGMRIGTPILAARSGKVIGARSDALWPCGFNPNCSKVNYIDIQHNDCTVGHYTHLRKPINGTPGVCVEVNNYVRQGDIIGYSGLTGKTFGPHLHFEVYEFRNAMVDAKVDTTFADVWSAGGIPNGYLWKKVPYTSANKVGVNWCENK